VAEVLSELTAQVVLSVIGHLTHSAQETPGLSSEFGQLFRPEYQYRDDTDDDKFGRTDTEHLAPYMFCVGVRPSCIPAGPRERPLKVSAMLWSVLAASESGSSVTIGNPASPPARKRSSSGTWPRTGTS